MIIKLQTAANSFSESHINIFNELFYRFAPDKLISDLPNIFTKLDFFNFALHKKITKEIHTDSIKLIEIASGARMDRWNTFMELDTKNTWDITLTDFADSLLPNTKSISTSNNFSFTTSKYSLYTPFPNYDNKFNIVLSSYTFDNLWLKKDIHLTKEKGLWYKTTFKIDITNVDKYLERIRENKKLDETFFKLVKIKTKKVKVSIQTIPYGSLIEKFFKNQQKVSVNVPLGLISKVIESFDKVLTPDGLFITADLAIKDKDALADGYKDVNETIKIKVEHYGLAKFILEQNGFSVELTTLHDFIRDSGIETAVEIYDHFVLIAKKDCKLSPTNS